MANRFTRLHPQSVSGRIESKPGIKRLNTRWLKICNIARDNRHAVYQGCRGDQAVANRAQVGHMKPCAAKRDCGIDRDNTVSESG